MALRLALMLAGGVAAAAGAATVPGDPDTTFGTGTVITNLGSNSDRVSAIVLQTDGKLVAAGTTAVNPGSPNQKLAFGLVRYLDNAALDQSEFNPDGAAPGTVTTAFGGDAEAKALVQQSDGKLVAAGYAPDPNNGYTDITVVRYDSDGGLDTTFNTTGIRTIDMGGNARAYALALQPDGKLVVAGYAPDANNSYHDIAVVRLKINGDLDQDFNPNGSTPGELVVGGMGAEAQANAVVVQPDKKIVVAGYVMAGATDGNFLVARFNADGTADTTFNAGGSPQGVAVNNLGGDDRADAVVVQPDGKIVAAGKGGAGDFALVRYAPDGTLDGTSFNAGGAQPGVVTTGFGGLAEATALALQPDGKLVAAGYAHPITASDFALVRYDSDGSLDTDFGRSVRTGTAQAGGSTTITLDGGASATNQAYRGMIVQITGGTGAGQSRQISDYNGTTKVATVSKAWGTQPDTTSKFGIRSLTLAVTNGNDAAYAVALDPASKIVVAGYTDNGTGRKDFALARFLATASGSTWTLSPQPFAFDNLTNVAPRTSTGQTNTVASNTITLAGLPSGFKVPVNVSGGAYATGSGTLSYTTDMGWAQTGDQFTVHQSVSQCGTDIQHPISTCGSRSVTTTLSVGGLVAPNNAAVVLGPVASGTFTSTVAQPPQITASHFSTTQSAEATTYYSLIPHASEPGLRNPTGLCGESPGRLKFSVTNKPSWARFDQACGKLDGFPGGGDLGTTKGVVISVKDSQTGLSAQLPAFSLQVTNSSDGGGLAPLSLVAMLLLAGWRRLAHGTGRGRGC